MRIKWFCCWIVVALMSISVSAQRHYVCYYTAQQPVIDGSGNDAVWLQAPWTEDFKDIEGDIRPKPSLRTRAKMLWDSTYLYIYAELQETDLWGTLHQHDTIIYEDNDFEVFINPNNSTHRYFELEINALGTVMDLFMNRPYRNGGKALLSWDAQGLLSAVKTAGTLNHPGDVDQGWSVEMAIPLKSLSFYGDRPVRDEDQWRINFSRVEWDRDVRDNQYLVRTNAATGRRLPEHNWVWSPQGIIDMHAPEKWAYLQFSTHGGGKDTVAFVVPEDAGATEELWKLYYLQRDYLQSHGRYAASLEELGVSGIKTKASMPDGEVLHMEVDKQGNVYQLTMESTGKQYTAMLRNDKVKGLSIDQDGEVRKPEQRD